MSELIYALRDDEVFGLAFRCSKCNGYIVSDVRGQEDETSRKCYPNYCQHCGEKFIGVNYNDEFKSFADFPEEPEIPEEE